MYVPMFKHPEFEEMEGVVYHDNCAEGRGIDCVGYVGHLDESPDPPSRRIGFDPSRIGVAVHRIVDVT
jgi:hypothetical protein